MFYEVNIVLASPTIKIPINARILPTSCLLKIGIFSKVTEKMKVVIILPPFII